MDEKPRRIIDGNWTTQQPVAFCFNKTNKGYLTLRILRKHKCLAKQCRYLKKLPHEYWDNREQIKVLKKSRKQALKVR